MIFLSQLSLPATAWTLIVVVVVETSSFIFEHLECSLEIVDLHVFICDLLVFNSFKHSFCKNLSVMYLLMVCL